MYHKIDINNNNNNNMFNNNKFNNNFLIKIKIRIRINIIINNNIQCQQCNKQQILNNNECIINQHRIYRIQCNLILHILCHHECNKYSNNKRFKKCNNNNI